ncbi:MAG: TolC family protein [Kofleriaceae bacterium]|nr:TolC family protein [Kofleriaceae bacterium]
MRLHLLPLIVASTLPSVARAEVVDEATLIKSLESSDPRVERLAAEVDAAHAHVKSAEIRPEPRIVADREHVFPSSGGLDTDYLRVVLPLDLSGRRGLRVDAARAEVRATQAQGDLGRLQVVVEGLRVFRETAYQRLRIELMTNERLALVRAVDIVSKRAKAGEASGYDRQRLELELGNYDDAITSATVELRASQRRLATLLGRVGSRVDAAGELALGNAPDVEALGVNALARRGDYRAAKLRIEAATDERKAANRSWVPIFELTGGAMSQQLETERGYGYVAGLSLNLPITGQGAAARARADATRRAATADARLLERDVPNAIRTAHETFAARIEQARVFQSTQLARLDQLLRSAETGYREGGGSIVELLDAYRSARDARLRELELRRDASLAELDLWLALGRRP